MFRSDAHDDAGHVDRVRDFWIFLRGHDIDARLGRPAALPCPLKILAVVAAPGTLDDRASAW